MTMNDVEELNALAARGERIRDDYARAVKIDPERGRQLIEHTITELQYLLFRA